MPVATLSELRFGSLVEHLPFLLLVVTANAPLPLLAPFHAVLVYVAIPLSLLIIL